MDRDKNQKMHIGNPLDNGKLPESEDKRDERKNRREEVLKLKRQQRLDKIKATTAKALAVAKKRKWLVFLIGIAIAAYFMISRGGGLGGILDKVKSFF
jgi:hypothetical protein